MFFVFKFVVVLLLVVRRGKVYLPMPLCWPEVLYVLLCITVIYNFYILNLTLEIIEKRYASVNAFRIFSMFSVLFLLLKIEI